MYIFIFLIFLNILSFLLISYLIINHKLPHDKEIMQMNKFIENFTLEDLDSLSEKDKFFILNQIFFYYSFSEDIEYFKLWNTPKSNVTYRLLDKKKKISTLSLYDALIKIDFKKKKISDTENKLQNKFKEIDLEIIKCNLKKELDNNNL